MFCFPVQSARPNYPCPPQYLSRQPNRLHAVFPMGPHVNASLIKSSTTINRNGRSHNPWCSPTLMRRSSVLLYLILTAAFASWYVTPTNLKSFSETPRFLRHQHTRFMGTLSFFRSPNVKNRSLISSRCFSYNCCRMNTASVVHVPWLKQNCISLTLSAFHYVRQKLHPMFLQLYASKSVHILEDALSV